LYWRHTPLKPSYRNQFLKHSTVYATVLFTFATFVWSSLPSGRFYAPAFAQKPVGKENSKSVSGSQALAQGSDARPVPGGTRSGHGYPWEEHVAGSHPDALGGYGMDNLFDNTASRRQSVVQLVRGDTRRKEVALTFDDGPHPPFTYKLLDLLKSLNVKATFFVVGFKVEDDPEVLQRMVAEGHEVANHTYHHPNLKLLPAGLIESEIRLNNDTIRRACGKEPVCFRPPGGQRSDEVLEIAHRLGMSTILWTDDPADYANPGSEVIEQKLLNHVKPGATILLHDGIEQTFQMLPNLVARLRQQGYHFVTVTEMIQHLESSRTGHTVTPHW